MIGRILHRRTQVLPPEYFTLSLVDVTTNSVEIAWGESRYATNYRIQRRLVGGVFSDLELIYIGNTYIDYSVSEDTAYEYRITSTNSSGYMRSNIISVTTLSSAPKPATNINFTNVTGTTLTVNWTAGANVDTYRIQRRKQGEGGWPVTVATGITGTSHNDSNLTPGTTYEYRITSYNAAGAVYSNIASVTTLVVNPTPATNLHFTSVEQTTLTINWTMGDLVDWQRVRRRLSGTTSWTTVADVGKDQSYNDSGLNNQTTYEYQIQSFNASGNVVSSIASVTTAAPLYSYNAYASAQGEGEILIDWMAIQDAHYYKVDRIIDGIWTQIATGIGVSQYLNTGLAGGTKYTYRVRAMLTSGSWAPYSNTTSATTIAASNPPTAPTGLTFSNVQENSLTLSWTAGNYVDYYRIQRRLSGTTTWGDVANQITGLSITDNGVESGTKYDYRVISYNAVGNASSAIASVTTVVSKPILTGGEESTVGGDKVHIFKQNGTLNVTKGGAVLSILVVAGGGGGGYMNSELRAGGGGGAGGVKYINNLVLNTGESIAVTVGKGGLGGNSGVAAGSNLRAATNGGNSYLGSYVSATGGGAGGNGTAYTQATGNGKTGGSGGGGGSALNPGGSRISGQGSIGGNSTSTRNSGGGGGAGSAGTNAPSSRTGGDGGQGVSYSITGTSQYYASGGAGYGDGGENSAPGAGYGKTYPGGGGNPGGNGIANTGGGGGAAVSELLDGGNGGSGIVIVRYQT